MATNKKISELPPASTPILSGVKFEALQGGVNVQVDADDMPGSGAGVTSVTGTTNRITSSGGATPVINIDTAYDAAIVAAYNAAILAALRLKRTVTGTDSGVQSDDNKLIIFNSATPFNFTLDQLTADTKISFINYGAGVVTFIAGSGVTITGGVTLAAAADPSFPSALVIYDTLTTPRIISGGAGTPATAADLVTGTDNVKFVTTLAFKGFRNLTRTAASVSAGTMTLTFAASEQERRFEATTTIASNFTIAFGGTLTAIEVFTLILPINGSIAITLPSTVLGERNDTRFVNATKILTLTSTASGDIFEISFTRKDGPKYMLRAGYAQIAT